MTNLEAILKVVDDADRKVQNAYSNYLMTVHEKEKLHRAIVEDLVREGNIGFVKLDVNLIRRTHMREERSGSRRITNKL